MIPSSPAQDPRRELGLVASGTPTLFINGEIDKRVPFSENEQLYVAIKKQGVPAKMIQYAGQPHGIAGSWNNIHRMLNERAWFDKYVKGNAVIQAGKIP